MLAAAQDAADIEPEQAKLTRKTLPLAVKIDDVSLGAAIRAAVYDEAERLARAGTLAPGRADNTSAVRRGNGDASSDRRGPSEMGQLHSLAASAQEAKRNVNIEKQHQKGSGEPGNQAAQGRISTSLSGASGKR